MCDNYDNQHKSETKSENNDDFEEKALSLQPKKFLFRIEQNKVVYV